MSLEDLFQLLNSINGFEDKVTYRAFPEGSAPNLPFICYLVTTTDNFKADGKVYKTKTNIDIELYTQKKDTVSEGKIETMLDNNSIPWDKSEDYLKDEHCLMITYEITI